jgi:quercetin dioxygenase-like cupin family protein
LKNIRLSFRTIVVLIASVLCHQVAIADYGPVTDKGLNAIQPRSVELSPEIGSRPERKLPVRLLTLEPGGIVYLRSQSRLTVLQVIKGILTSHPQGKPAVVLRAGVGLVQDKDSNFWVHNTGSGPAQFIWLPIY